MDMEHHEISAEPPTPEQIIAAQAMLGERERYMIEKYPDASQRQEVLITMAARLCGGMLDEYIDRYATFVNEHLAEDPNRLAVLTGDDEDLRREAYDALECYAREHAAKARH